MTVTATKRRMPLKFQNLTDGLLPLQLYGEEDDTINSIILTSFP
jgi:hypothetical protein